MRRFNKLVVVFGVFTIVSVAALSGSVAEASNNRKMTPKIHASLAQKIQALNDEGDGCRQ